MDDLISRADAIKAIFEAFSTGDEGADRYIAEKILADVPSAQPEIIRCKDCKYCEHWYADKGRCFLWHEDGIDVFGDGFCNYAERREEHETD